MVSAALLTGSVNMMALPSGFPDALATHRLWYLPNVYRSISWKPTAGLGACSRIMAMPESPRVRRSMRGAGQAVGDGVGRQVDGEFRVSRHAPRLNAGHPFQREIDLGAAALQDLLGGHFPGGQICPQAFDQGAATGGLRRWWQAWH